MKYLSLMLIGFFFSPLAHTATVQSASFKKNHKLSLNLKSITRKNSGGTNVKDSGSGFSYRYRIVSNVELGFDYYTSDSSQGQGSVAMDINFQEGFFYANRSFSTFDQPGFYAKAGLGILQESVQYSLISSSSSASEIRSFYGLGLGFNFYLNELFKSPNPKMNQLIYDMGFMLRGEIENTGQKYIDFKLFGLGYQF